MKVQPRINLRNRRKLIVLCSDIKLSKKFLNDNRFVNDMYSRNSLLIKIEIFYYVNNERSKKDEIFILLKLTIQIYLGWVV